MAKFIETLINLFKSKDAANTTPNIVKFDPSDPNLDDYDPVSCLSKYLK